MAINGLLEPLFQKRVPAGFVHRRSEEVLMFLLQIAMSEKYGPLTRRGSSRESSCARVLRRIPPFAPVERASQVDAEPAIAPQIRAPQRLQLAPDHHD